MKLGIKLTIITLERDWNLWPDIGAVLLPIELNNPAGRLEVETLF